MKKLSNDGFTLVELMVVVSIIGILSAVAIPNFKSYQAKSKTSEAKLQLASMYSAETALQSDYDSYATCLGFAGYSAPVQGNYYALGFDAANVTPDGLVDTAASGAACAASSTAGEFGVDSGRTVAGSAITKTNLSVIATTNAGMIAADALKAGVGVSATGNWFVIGAIGIISSSAGTTILTQADQWLMDENKLLINQVSGVSPDGS